MKLCGSVNWCRIGWLVVVFNLLLYPNISFSQNLPPVIDMGVPNQHAEVGLPFSYAIPANTFKDEDNDPLTYQVTNLPAGLSYNETGRLITGTPTLPGEIKWVSLRANDSKGGSREISFRIEVHPSGSTYAAFTMNTQTGCNYREIQFENKSKGATSYSWVLGNGNTSTLANPSAIYSKPGRYTVTLTINGGGQPAYSHTEEITIYPKPAPAIASVTASGCAPMDLTLTSTGIPVSVAATTINDYPVGGISGGSESYHYWYFFEKHDGKHNTNLPSVNVTGLQGGTYNVMLSVTDVNGCQGNKIESGLFTVLSQPVADFTFVKQNNCEPSFTTFTAKSIVDGGTIASYTWNVNGIDYHTTGNIFTYDFSFWPPGTYPVELTVTTTNDCVSMPVVKNVVFNNNNSVDFDLAEAYCLGSPVVINAITSDSAIGYKWDIGNDGSVESTDANFNRTFESRGEYDVELEVKFNDGCIVETIKKVKIDQAYANFIETSEYLCVSNTYQVSFTSQAYTYWGREIIGYNWYLVSNNSETLIGTDSLIQYTFTGQGSYNIRHDVVSEDGCTASFFRTINLQQPTLTVNISGAKTGCFVPANATHFEAILNSQFELPMVFNWDFGDGNTGVGANTSHTYAAGKYTVELSVTTSSGCTYNTILEDAIQLANPPVLSNVSYIQSANKCYGDGIRITGEYTTGVDQLNVLSPFGLDVIEDPGGSPFNHLVTFPDTGKFNLIITAQQYGCESNAFNISNIKLHEPKASFIPSQTSFCANPPYDALFFKNSIYRDSAATQFSWNFGDGATSTSTADSVTHQYSQTGNFQVRLSVINTLTGCSDSYTNTLRIYSFNDSIGIIDANTTVGCAPLQVSFTQKIKDRLSSNYIIDELHWDFDNDEQFDTITTSLDPMVHVYTKPGKYPVRLKVTSKTGCGYEFVEKDLIKVSGPIVNFGHSPAQVCLGSAVNFENLTTKPAFDSTALFNSYLWDFGDGSTSSVINPVHNFNSSSKFTVSLRATDNNGCTSIITKPDYINIIPFEPLFELSDSVVCINGQFNINNRSSGVISQYRLNFGDGSPVLATNNFGSVSHQYANSGTYTIELEAEVLDGCTKTFSKTIRVVNSTAAFTVFPNDLGCAPTFAHFVPLASEGDVLKYEWVFGNGNVSYERNPRSFFARPGNYNVKLVVTFKGNCQDSTEQVIFVDGAIGNFDYDNTPGCAPNAVVFSVSNMRKVDLITWDFGRGITRTDLIPAGTVYRETSYTYESLDSVYPRVILTDKVCGEYAYDNSAKGIIYTSEPPSANFSFNFDSICNGLPIQFEDESTIIDQRYGITGWEWDFGTTKREKSYIQNPSFAYTEKGVYSPGLTVTNGLGCSNKITKENIIHIYSNDNLSSYFDIGINNDDTLVCAWQVVDFYSQADAGTSSIINYEWKFGTENTTGQNATYAFPNSMKGQKVRVTHFVTDDKFCIDSTSRTVEINNLQAAFGYGPQPVFRGSAVDFTDQSTVRPGNFIADYAWDFGIGEPSSSLEWNPPAVQYDTIHNDNQVSLIVTDNTGCKDTTLAVFDVRNNPPLLKPLSMNVVENTSYSYNQSNFKEIFDPADPDQELVFIRLESAPANGSLRLNGLPYVLNTPIPVNQIGLLEFVPNTDWIGPTQFQWNGYDGFDWSLTPEQVYVEVLETPPPPVLSDIVFYLPEDQTVTLTKQDFIDHLETVLGNMFYFDHLQLLTSITPSSGALKYHGAPLTGTYPKIISGSELDDENAFFRFIPGNGYNGTVSFFWNVRDRYNYAVQPARVIITYYNSAPVLKNVVVDNIKENSLVVIPKADFLANYHDPDIYDLPQTFYLTNIPPSGEGRFSYGTQFITNNNFSINIDLLNELRFFPAQGFEGTTQATWLVSDGSDLGMANILLTFVNTPPVVHNFSLIGYEDVELTFQIIHFDKGRTINRPFEDDDHTDSLKAIQIVSLPLSGTLWYNGNLAAEGMVINRADIPRLKYLTTPDWNGPDSFLYNAFDGTDWALADATVFLEITPVNDAPRPVPHILYMLEDDQLTDISIAGDYDVDHSPLELVYHIAVADSGTARQNGIVNLDLLGNLSYVPNPDFNGELTFFYTVCDPLTACASEQVTIRVLPMNDPPTTVKDTFNIFENELVSYFNCLLTDFDIDGDNIYLTQVNNQDENQIETRYGTLTWVVNGDLNFVMPAALDTLMLGESILIHFDYTIEDDSLASDNGVFVIKINGLNNPPVAVADVFEAYEGFGVIGSNISGYLNILDNDEDIENENVTINTVNNSTIKNIEGAYGTFSWDTDGLWRFEENYEVTIQLRKDTVVQTVYPYDITDGHDVSTLMSTITIRITGVNDNPTVVNDTLIIYEDAGTVAISVSDVEALLQNDSDIDGDNYSVVQVENDTLGVVQSEVGELLWKADGSYIYTPDRDSVIRLAEGDTIADIFKYIIVDEYGGRDSARLVIQILGLNDPPFAHNDSITIYEDSHSTIVDEENGLLANDGDIDRDPIVVAVNDDGSHTLEGNYGTLIWEPNGAYTYITFTDIVDTLYHGEVVVDVFTYTVKDPFGLTDRANLYVTIIGENDPPVAIDHWVMIYEKELNLTVTNRVEGILADDYDVDDHDLFGIITIDGETNTPITGRYGTLDWNYDGVFSYTLNPETDTLQYLEAVVDSFLYIIQDRFDSTAFAWFYIEIIGENDDPIAHNDTLRVTEDDIRVQPGWSLLDNDEDIDGDSITLYRLFGQTVSPVSTLFTQFEWDVDGFFVYNRYEYGNKRIELDTLAWNDKVFDSIAYTIIDENGIEAMAYLHLEILGVNDAPVANTDVNTISENSDSIFSRHNNYLLYNDYDVDRGDSIMLRDIAGDTTGRIEGTFGHLVWDERGHYIYYSNKEATDSLAFRERAFDKFLYTIVDLQGATNTDTLIITILGVNDEPVAVNDTISIFENERFLNIHPENNGLLWNDYDVDRDSIYILLPGNAAVFDFTGVYGTLTVHSNGQATYLLNEELDTLYSGEVVTDLFDYTLYDQHGYNAKAKVIINITGENDLPVTQDIFMTIDEDTELIVAALTDEHALLYHALDIDGDSLDVIQVNDSVSSMVQGVYGDLHWLANGEYTFLTNMLITQALAEGDTVYEVFVFVISDPFGGTDTASLSIEIIGLNDPPVALPDYYEIIEFKSMRLTAASPDHILGNDYDVDRNDSFGITMINLSQSSTVQGDHGTLMWQPDGEFAYYPDTIPALLLRPAETLNEVFEYTIADSFGASDTSTFTFTIIGVNNAPTIEHNDTIRIEQNRLIAKSKNGLLYSAFDWDNDTLQVIKVVTDTTGVYNEDRYGDVSWLPDGNVAYLADTLLYRQLGPTEQRRKSFRYTIADEWGATAQAELIVFLYGVNDPVVAHADGDTIMEDSFSVYNVLANDEDPDFGGKGNIDYGSLSISIGPKNGTAHVNTATGEIYYVPKKNFNGIDSLLYKICDAGHPVECDEAWFFIHVTPVNDPPVATNLLLNTPIDTPVSFNLFNQVVDVDDDINPTSLAITYHPKNGTVDNDQLNDSVLVYKPNATFTGIDEFVYSLADSAEQRAYVLVTIIVPDDRFGAQNDFVITRENTFCEIDILANDTLNNFLPNPNAVDIRIFPANGTASYNPFTRLITYQPNRNFNGHDSLIYIVGSKTGNWDFATVYIEVQPVNRPIVANDDAVSLYNDVAVEIRILQNDYDFDDGIDTSSVNILVEPMNGKVIFDSVSGYAYYTPNASFRGSDSFEYSVCDLNVKPTCDTATVHIIVRSEYIGMFALNDSYKTDEDESKVLIDPKPPIDNDSVVGGVISRGSFTIIAPPQFGTYIIDEVSKVITYTPNENYFGLDWMTYRICDDNGNCDFAQINIWVNPVNDPPVANDDFYVVNENLPKRFFVLSNDYDVDGHLNWATLDTIAGAGPRKGNVIIDKETGTILYEPMTNADVDEFKYRICDNEGACDEAYILVIVDLGNTIPHFQKVTEDVPDTFSIAPLMATYNLFFPISSADEEVAPEKGSWKIINNNTQIVFHPDTNKNGRDYYNLYLLSASNDTVDLRVYVEIEPVNDPPVAEPDTITWNGTEKETVISFKEILKNDYDVDDDAIFLTEGAFAHSESFNIEFNPTDSTITISADSITWCDAWFTYQISDPDGETAIGYVWIVPDLKGLFANNDTVDVFEINGKTLPDGMNNYIDILANDSIKDNQRCTIDSMFIIIPPQNGIAAISENQMLLYRPDDHYYGSDSLRYHFIDIWGRADSAWVYIDVIQRNTPPVAVDDVVDNDFSSEIIIKFLEKDYDPDPDGYIDTLRTYITLGEEPRFGTVSFDPDSGWFVYTPINFSCEDDQFGYTIFDNEGDSAMATVTVRLPEEATIFAITDTVKTWPGVPVEFNVLANDLGYFLPFVETYSLPSNGNIELSGDSTFVFYPYADFMDKDSMTYNLVSFCGDIKPGKIIFIIEELRVPEIITPNNDGKNDQLIIDGIEHFPESVLQIYNRYGHIVYERRGYQNDWNGYSNKGSFMGDKPLPSGMYYYTLNYNGGRNKQTGSIYIFR